MDHVIHSNLCTAAGHGAIGGPRTSAESHGASGVRGMLEKEERRAAWEEWCEGNEVRPKGWEERWGRWMKRSEGKRDKW